MRLTIIFVVFLAFPMISIAAELNHQVNKTQIEQSFGQLPLYFIENQGQLDG